MTNSLFNIYALLMILSALIAAFSQILLKQSANIQYKNRLREILNLRVIISYFLLFLTMIINVYAYSGLDYKLGPILNSTTYIFVVILSVLILKEKIKKKSLIGIAFIILGIVLFNF